MHPERQQRGFSLPLAVFIITVLALIGTAMVNLSRSGQQAVSAEVQSVRAFYAAESGAQLALHTIFPLSGGSIGVVACSALSLTPTYSAQGIEGCDASVSCTPQSVGGNTYYIVSSTGVCTFGGSANTARRSIEVMAKSP